MEKIVEIEEQLDAGQDDDCYEIDPAEFAKKVHLKESADVLIVATKGEIKAEVNQPADCAKTLNGHNSEDQWYSDIRLLCPCPGNTSGDTCKSGVAIANVKLHEYAAGDCVDKPYEIDEDEATLQKVESDEDKFVLEKLSASAKNITDVLNDGKCLHVNEDERRFEVIPPKSVVKCEPQDRNGVEEDVYCSEIDDLNHDELYPVEYRVFDEEDDGDVVVVGREDV